MICAFNKFSARTCMPYNVQSILASAMMLHLLFQVIQKFMLINMQILSTKILCLFCCIAWLQIHTSSTCFHFDTQLWTQRHPKSHNKALVACEISWHATQIKHTNSFVALLTCLEPTNSYAILAKTQSLGILAAYVLHKLIIE